MVLNYITVLYLRLKAR